MRVGLLFIEWVQFTLIKKMVSDFRKASFPKLVASTIAEKDGVTVLEVVKEFGVDVNAMKFE